MAIINKKLVHFTSVPANIFYATDESNTEFINISSITHPASYFESSSDIAIKFLSIVFFKDVKRIWTHGQLYECNANADDLMDYTYLTIEESLLGHDLLYTGVLQIAGTSLPADESTATPGVYYDSSTIAFYKIPSKLKADERYNDSRGLARTDNVYSINNKLCYINGRNVTYFATALDLLLKVTEINQAIYSRIQNTYGDILINNTASTWMNTGTVAIPFADLKPGDKINIMDSTNSESVAYEGIVISATPTSACVMMHNNIVSGQFTIFIFNSDQTYEMIRNKRVWDGDTNMMTFILKARIGDIYVDSSNTTLTFKGITIRDYPTNLAGIYALFYNGSTTIFAYRVALSKTLSTTTVYNTSISAT